MVPTRVNKTSRLPMSTWRRFKSLLAEPVSGASLGVFRSAVGIIMALEAYALCRPSASTMGTTPIEVYYTSPDIKFRFPYEAFQWLPVLPAHWIYALVALQAVAGVTMALGLCYRLSAATVFLSWGYLYALESTRTYWMSHFYLELLVTFLMIWMPAGRIYSVDAWIRGRLKAGAWERFPSCSWFRSRFSPLPRPSPSERGRDDSSAQKYQGPPPRTSPGGGHPPPEGEGRRGGEVTVRTPTGERTESCMQKPPGLIPYWPILLLRGQLVISYFYAGLAKVNADWLGHAEPVRYFLSKARAITAFAPYLSAPQTELLKRVLHSTATAYFISYAGAFFDLSVGFLLLVRRTRIFAMVLMVLFHATNHFIIFDDIGFFPLLGVATATIFFDPAWPERFWRWLRHPSLSKPDWPWLAAGGILFPLLGVSLGWKLKPSVAPVGATERFRLPRSVGLLVLFWLIWQTLVPLRGYFIAGDSRMTWEGLSFSWRLKAEVYRSGPAELRVEDPKIISREPTGRIRIDWGQWHGEKVIFRKVTPGQIDWGQLPEIVVLLEPLIGERIIYNPYAGSNAGRPEAQSRERVGRLWQELYGRPPQAVSRAYPPAQVLVAPARELRSKGYMVNSLEGMLKALDKLYGPDGKGRIIPLLREANPFFIAGALASPFLVIEDASLLHGAVANPWRIDPLKWVDGRCTRSPEEPAYLNVGGTPLVILTCELGSDAKEMVPQAVIFDSQQAADQGPFISWNSLNELTVSEIMHLSTQPFLLRRYARHVASLWQKDYGRRPAIHALTAVSLNGRPAQPQVDPDADLATVSEAWFRHDTWIRDLAVRQMKEDGLVRADK